MRRAVDAPRHPADDRQAAPGEVAPQPLRHLIAVGRRPPRAHHGDRVPVQHAGVSAHVEQRRRIVDFEQPLRIFRLVPIQQAAAELADLREFRFGILVRAVRLDGPRGRRRQPACFEFGQGRAKDFLRAIRIGAEVFPPGASPGPASSTVTANRGKLPVPRWTGRYYVVIIRVKSITVNVRFVQYSVGKVYASTHAAIQSESGLT